MPNQQHLAYALAVVLLSLASCGEEPSGPQLPDAVPTTQPATQPAHHDGADLVQMVSADTPAANTVCPVSGEAINPKGGKVSYAGKAYGFCCDGCIKSFKADPAKYAAAIK